MADGKEKEEEEQKAQTEEEKAEAPPKDTLEEEDVSSLVAQAEKEDDGSPMTLEDLGAGGAKKAESSIDMLMDVTLNVRIELGRTNMSVEDILKLGGGAVVTLDKLAGDFVDVLVNDKLVARGEVLILNDNFCVRIAEIVPPEEREDATGL